MIGIAIGLVLGVLLASAVYAMCGAMSDYRRIMGAFDVEEE